MPPPSHQPIASTSKGKRRRRLNNEEESAYLDNEASKEPDEGVLREKREDVSDHMAKIEELVTDFVQCF